jgi:hypothetical protein
LEYSLTCKWDYILPALQVQLMIWMVPDACGEGSITEFFTVVFNVLRSNGKWTSIFSCVILRTVHLTICDGPKKPCEFDREQGRDRSIT